MSAQKAASWGYAEDFVVEDAVLEDARRQGEQLGCTPIAKSVGAALRMITAAMGAKAVVEVGTGAGVSGLWLLAGMPSDGILTTIDLEAEHQRAAREAYASAGIAHQRTRVITGRALDVLRRMTDGAYDVVFLDGEEREYPAYVEEAARLLRSGGVLVLDDILWHDKVADPAARDDTTRMLRELSRTLRDDERFFTTLLTAGNGVLISVKR
jgi:predicted O-methyltransferase YrrM